MYDERELLKGNTPTLVLAALSEGPQHGYAIAQAINRRTENALKFKQGTLYPVLHSLEREGLVAGEWQHTTGTRPRFVYEITDAGRAELARRAAVWSTFAEAMGKMIAGARAGDTPDEQPA